jgi:phosphatidylinositol alpha 1,6-mannosyltransferase
MTPATEAAMAAVVDAPRATVQRDIGVRPAEEIRLALFSDTYTPQLNGVTRTLERLVAAVRERGGAARVYTTTDPGTPDPAGIAGSIWRRPSVPFWAYPQLRIAAPVLGEAYKDLRAWRPTIIHAATPFGMGLAGRACARALRVPLVSSYHTSFNEYAKFYRLGALSGPGWSYVRWFHNGGVRTFVPTHAVLDELTQLQFKRLAIWGRGVDGARFSPAFRSNAVRMRLGADDDTIVVAYVGRLAAEKGLDVALGAIRDLSASPAGGAGVSRPRILFAFAGDGPYAEHCRKWVPEGAAVRFVGPLEGRALSEFYASADLFIFPSATDTFGNVLLEAMASGLPVIGAASGPTRELLAAGGGITFPPGDSHAMAGAILSLAGDAARRKSIAGDGCRYAATCSWGRIFDDLVGEYCEVIAGAGAIRA